MKTKQNIKCVTISNNLTWDRHIDNTIGKGNKTLGFIRRNLKDCTKPVKSAAYTSMVRPTMEYASSVWDPTNRKKIGNLEGRTNFRRPHCSFFLDKGDLCL
jgi:hypothetical protein